MASSRFSTVGKYLTTSSIATVTSALGAAIGVGYLLFDKILFPFGNDDPEDLPPCWHPFHEDDAKVIFKEKLSCCEDVVLDHEKGIAIISCDPGRPRWNTVMNTMYDPSPKGTLYLYDYASKKDLHPLELVAFPRDADFHPLGINIFRPKHANITRLFVVNHQRNGSTVDVFDLEYAHRQATFIMSISDGDHNILSPNAIAPISYTSFYVTNDHRFIPRLRPHLNRQETYRALPLGWVTLVDFAKGNPTFKTVANGIPFANGIVLTPTGKEVIVASTTGSELYVYDRDPKTNLLSAVRDRIPTTFRPDNLNFDDSLDVNSRLAFDKDGRFLRGLTCGGHPSGGGIQAMSRDPLNKFAPSWVVEVRRGHGVDRAPTSAMRKGRSENYHLQTLYQSDGSHFPSSTTGAIDLKRHFLIVTGLYAQGILEISWANDEI